MDQQFGRFSSELGKYGFKHDRWPLYDSSIEQFKF
jgi:hypothetical protein